MKKKLGKVLNCMGDVTIAGVGVTIVYYGFKVVKWAFTELENEF